MPSHRTRSPHSKIDKGKGKLKREKEEKLVFVRKRYRHRDDEPKTIPDWITDLARATVSREHRKNYKYMYSVEKRGGYRRRVSSMEEEEDMAGENGDWNKEKYPMIHDGHVNRHQIVPDGNGGYVRVASDRTGDAYATDVEDRARKLMEMPRDVLERMQSEERRRRRKQLVRNLEEVNLRSNSSSLPKAEPDETEYERYLRTKGKREDP